MGDAAEPDLIEAVVGLDVLFRHQRPRAGAMDGWVAARPRTRAATAIGLADGRSESPQESRTRVRLVLAGFSPPVPQYEVRVRGVFVARVDLAWPDAKVAVEYDGRYHVGDARQMEADQARSNRLVDAGWAVLHLTARDLSDPALFDRFCAQLQRVLARSYKNS